MKSNDKEDREGAHTQQAEQETEKEVPQTETVGNRSSGSTSTTTGSSSSSTSSDHHHQQAPQKNVQNHTPSKNQKATKEEAEEGEATSLTSEEPDDLDEDEQAIQQQQHNLGRGRSGSFSFLSFNSTSSLSFLIDDDVVTPLTGPAKVDFGELTKSRHPILQGIDFVITFLIVRFVCVCVYVEM